MRPEKKFSFQLKIKDVYIKLIHFNNLLYYSMQLFKYNFCMQIFPFDFNLLQKY